jgi:UDP-N-acetylglucosamine transferase subunit ALG13
MAADARVASEDGLASLRGCRGLLVASSGGHLSELLHLVDLIGIHRDSLVVTFDTPQSRSLLASRPHLFVPYVPPRDLLGTARTAHMLTQVSNFAPGFVLSTGASVAISAWWAARRARADFYYIESFARLDGPSLTGKLLAHLPRARRFTQHPQWSRSGWEPCRDVLGAFAPRLASGADRVSRHPLKVFVTLGTIRPYRFDRLVDRVLEATGPDDELTWQLGSTQRDDLPGTVRQEIGAEAFDEAIHSADVVVAQAGVGTLLRCLELGVTPVAVPRLAWHNEHVDDHQVQIARLLRRRDLALAADASALARADLYRAAAARHAFLHPPGAPPQTVWTAYPPVPC